MDRFCGNCFNNTLNERNICTVCGFDAARNSQAAPHALPAGTILNGRYIIGRILGQGGFGITYTAQDYQTRELVAVKEFFPDSMATRSDRVTVTPFLGERGENYAYGLKTFLQEAETMAQFIGNPNIVRVYSYFEENGTAYFVMEYVDGVSLQSYLKSKGGQISFEEAAEILIPIMDALSAVHEKGIIHRDVAPDNIYISKNGTIKLLDFGAARYSLGNASRSLDVILKHGFAPKEQYKRRGRQGPYTDVYSLGATMYFSITGVRPDDAIERSDEDDMPYPSTLNRQITSRQDKILLKAMAVDYQDRYQTMAEFKKAVLNHAAQSDASLKEKLRRQKELLRLETLRRKEELLKKQEEERRKQEELRRQEEERCKQEELRRQEEERRKLEELRRQEEERRILEELRRQEEERRKQEELRRQEEERRKQEELRRLEEERRQLEELRRQEEERRKLEELRRQEEERRKQEELRRLEEERRKQEELRKQEEERRKQEELRKQEEERHHLKTLREQEETHQKQEAQRKQEDTHKQEILQQRQKSKLNKPQKWLIPAITVAVFAAVCILLIPKFATQPESVSLSASEPMPTETYTENTTSPSVPETTPTETHPEPTETTVPVATPEEGPNGERYFVASEAGNTLTITGKDLAITVVDDKDVTVTITGIDVKDSYLTNKKNTKKNYAEYNWSVRMFGQNTAYDVGTISFAHEPGAEEIKSPREMQHRLTVQKDANTWSNVSYKVHVNMDYTKNSMIWSYSMDYSCYFDFRNAEKFLVSAFVTADDGSTELYFQQTYIPKSGQTTPASGTEDATVPPAATATPNAQQLFEEDLAFKSNSITPVRMRETGYSLHSAKFLNKPVNNCVSLTAEIKVKEGAPKEFIVYLHDLDKWYEAGRIKATGEEVITGTLKFSKPISFNAFVIAPSEGDYATSISYKLVGAEIKGGPLSFTAADNSIIYSGDNLTVEIKNNRDITVTVSGLELLDEYPSYVSGGKGTEEYRWSVYMTSGDHYLSLRTDCPVPVKQFGKPKITKWSKMDHTVRLGRFEFGELDNHVVKDLTPTVSHTADSITWKFKLDKNQPFDFTTGITVKVDWFDRVNHKQDTLYYYGS